MKETVRINELALCHKHSDGWVRSTFPDVCKSPTSPVPYTNVAYARDLKDGTTTVRSHGGAMNGVKGSRFYRSFGDEPGTGGGVISGVNMDEATWLSWSPNVFMEGRPVTRLTDKMLLNKGNTVSIGGYYTGNPNDDKSKPLLEQICKAACECQAAGTMNGKCVADKVENWAKNLGRNIVPEIAWQIVDGIWSMRQGPNGEILRGGGKRPVDFVDFDLGSGVEYKGVRDRMRGGQSKNIDDITRDNGLTREDVNFKNDCDCSGGGGTAPAPVTSPDTQQAPEEDTSTLGQVKQFAYNHPYLTALGVVGAGILTGGAIYYGGAAAAALLGTGAAGGALAMAPAM